MVKRFVLSLVAACGASPAPPAPVARVEPLVIAVDAGPKCVAPANDPPPAWSGTYPKTFPRMSNEAMGEKQKALVARNPGVEAFLFDDHGLVYGFMTAKLPYVRDEMTIEFLTGRNVLADSRSILDELRCQGPDIARFEPTKAWIGRSTHDSLIFERPLAFDDHVRDEPLPPQLDDDALLAKWNLSVEVARVHKVVIHVPGQHCSPSPNQPCDPVAPHDETIDKRVVVGSVPIAKTYLKVTVTRRTFQRAAAFELRLVARVEVRWPELLSQVVVPRFGAQLEPQIAGNYQELFDAVTGDAVNPYAP